MRKLTDKLSAQRIVARFQLEAMANLRPKTTGIEGAVIWVSAGEFSGSDLQHGPRIKVVLGNKLTSEGLKDAVTVRLTTPPEILGTLPGKIKKQVLQFVNENRDILLKHWNFKLDIKEMTDQLQKVQNK